MANIAGKSQNGVAISGLDERICRETERAQVSTLLNISGGKAKGAQVSAIGNVGVNVNGMRNLRHQQYLAAEKSEGLQLCGAVNIAVKTENALQFSGLTNVCQGKLARLLQFAPATTRPNVAQIGLLNRCVAGNVKEYK